MIQSLKNEDDAKKLLNFSVKMARSMLSYGAEVYRVEDTINRIYKSFDNIKAANTLVTYNFVIVSFVYNDINYTTMRRIILGNRNLEKISLINDLSRKIVTEGWSIDYSYKKLREIKVTKEYNPWLVIFLLALSGPFFSIMFGGTFKDSIYSFLIMGLEGAFLSFATKYKLMDLMQNFFGALLVTVLVEFSTNFFTIYNPSSIVIAGIMPLVPGVQITNCVRDLMAGDYISGMIGVQSAVFTSIAIALGVILGLKIV